MTQQTETSPATIVTDADRDLREALIGHWEDLPKAGIDKLLAEHRIASTTEAAALMDEMAEALDSLITAVKFEVPPIIDGVQVGGRARILLECAEEARAVLAKLGGQHD
jgi:hypothetical protein